MLILKGGSEMAVWRRKYEASQIEESARKQHVAGKQPAAAPKPSSRKQAKVAEMSVGQLMRAAGSDSDDDDPPAPLATPELFGEPSGLAGDPCVVDSD